MLSYGSIADFIYKYIKIGKKKLAIGCLKYFFSGVWFHVFVKSIVVVPPLMILGEF